MEMTIGVRRTIMQDVAGAVSANSANFTVKIFLLPFFEDLRLTLGKIGLHGKIGLR